MGERVSATVSVLVNGQAASTVDFGAVLPGQSATPVTVTFTNTGTVAFLAVRLRIVQGNTDAARGTASVNGVNVTNTYHDAGPLGVGESLSVTVGWETDAGTTGVTVDTASLQYALDY